MKRPSDVPHKKLKLGEILIEAGLIDASQLDAALALQREKGGRLGASLVKLGYVTEEKLLASLADQLKLPRLDLSSREIPQEVLDYLPAEKARQYHVIPVARKEMHGTLFLLVAMTDPTNLTAIDDLQFITGCRVRPGLSSEASIQDAIDCFYGPLPADASPPAGGEGPSEFSHPLPVIDRAGTTEEKLQRLLKILMDRGILSLRDFDRLS